MPADGLFSLLNLGLDASHAIYIEKKAEIYAGYVEAGVLSYPE